MSKYTTELRYLIDSGYNLGLDAYPIFDAAYRAGLNAKIMAHYYFREIGAETADRFKFYLNTSMNEIMPAMNKLYLSAQLQFDPMKTYDFTEITDSSALDNTASALASAANNSGSGLSVESDTPQSFLSTGDLANNTWASGANKQENSAEQTATQKSSAAHEAVGKVIRAASGHTNGKSYSELLNEYRSTIIDIDMKVIAALESCFMGVY